MKRNIYYQLPAFTLIRTIFNTLYRMVYPFLSAISRGLGVDITMVSLAITSRSVIGIFGPFLGAIADRRGRKAGMLLGLSLYIFGVAALVLFPIFPMLVLCLGLTTLGKYVFDPAMQAYLGDRIPYERRGFALAVVEGGWSLSFIAGVPLAAFLIAKTGWLSPFWLLGGLGLLAMLVILRMIPSDDHHKHTPPFWAHASNILQYTPALAGLSIGITASTANEVVNLIFGIWLEDSFGLKILALGGASAVIGISELGGESLVGIFSDRIGKVKSVGFGLLLNCVAAALLPLIGRTVTGALIGLFLFYITFEFTLVASIPMMTELVPESRATLMSFNVAGLSLGRAIGALIATPVYHWGIGMSVCVAIFFNLLGWTATRYVGKHHH